VGVLVELGTTKREQTEHFWLYVSDINRWQPGHWLLLTLMAEVFLWLTKADEK